MTMELSGVGSGVGVGDGMGVGDGVGVGDGGEANGCWRRGVASVLVWAMVWVLATVLVLAIAWVWVSV